MNKKAFLKKLKETVSKEEKDFQFSIRNRTKISTLDSDYAKIEEPDDSKSDEVEALRLMLIEERKRKLNIEARISKMENRMSYIEYGELEYLMPLDTSFPSFSSHGNVKKTKFVKRGSIDVPPSSTNDGDEPETKRQVRRKTEIITQKTELITTKTNIQETPTQSPNVSQEETPSLKRKREDESEDENPTKKAREE